MSIVKIGACYYYGGTPVSLERSIDRVHVRCLRVRLTVCSLLPLPLVPSPMHAFQRESRKRSGGAEGDKSDAQQRGHGPTPDASVPPLMSPPVILNARARVYRCCRRERGIPSVTPPAKDRPVCGPRAPPGSASVAALRTPQASFAHRKA